MKLDIAVLMQCSSVDSTWGFNPELLLEGQYLENQLELLGKFNSEPVYLVTTGSPADDRLASFAQQYDIQVERVTEEIYQDRGMVNILQQLPPELPVLFHSPYLILAECELLQLAVEKLVDEQLDLVKFSVNFAHCLPLVSRARALGQGLEKFGSNYQDPVRQKTDFSPDSLINPEIPPWLYPSRLVAPMERQLELKTDRLEWGDDLFSHHRPGVFRPYLTTRKTADHWNQMGADKQPDFSRLVNLNSRRLAEHPSAPLALQLDLPSSVPLAGAEFYQGGEDKLQVELLVENLQRLSEARPDPLFQRYLQLGCFFDPLACRELERVLELLEDLPLKIGLHTGGVNLTASRARKLSSLVDEIFLYLKGFPESSVSFEERQVAYKLFHRALARRWRQRAVPDYPVDPLLSAVFQLPEEQDLEAYRDLTEGWVSWADLEKRFDSPAGIDYQKVCEIFYKGTGKLTWSPVIREKMANTLGKDSSNYSPYKRFPCRRLREALYLGPGGDVYPCVVAPTGSEQICLGRLTGADSLADCWLSDSHQEFLKKQLESNSSFNSCEKCNGWYDSVI